MLNMIREAGGTLELSADKKLIFLRVPVVMTLDSTEAYRLAGLLEAMATTVEDHERGYENALDTGKPD